MMQLMTIGYEGCTLESFFAMLIKNNVQTLVDVRELPLSRKAGFSKTALGDACTRHHIHYVHMRALGCPKAIRYDYRLDKNWQRFTQRYLAYLETQVDMLQILVERSQRERCCLLCFEADYQMCHRQYVAKKVVDLDTTDKTVLHLKS